MKKPKNKNSNQECCNYLGTCKNKAYKEVYLDLLATLHKNQIIKKIGHIKNAEIKKEINNKLKLLLDTQN